MQELRGYSPLGSSAALAPGPVTGLIASMLAGFLLSRKVKPYIVLVISMWAFFVGSLLWALAPVEQTYWINSFIGVLIIPFGMDMSNPAASILLSNSMAKEHQGTAASLVVTTVNYSISLALGIAGSVELGARGRRGDLLDGYRGAQYLGLGLGGLGLLLSAVFALRSRTQAKHAKEEGANAG
jgi:MFS family permease